MRKQWTIIVAACLLTGGLAYGRFIKWKDTDAPPVSLKTAVTLAEAALKMEPTKYFCLGATLARTFSEGDWVLHFSSKEGREMWVSVGSDKKIHISKKGFDYP